MHLGSRNVSGDIFVMHVGVMLSLFLYKIMCNDERLP